MNFLRDGLDELVGETGSQTSARRHPPNSRVVPRDQGEGFDADNEQVERRRLTLWQMGLRLIQLVVHPSLHRS